MKQAVFDPRPRPSRFRAGDCRPGVRKACQAASFAALLAVLAACSSIPAGPDADHPSAKRVARYGLPSGSPSFGNKDNPAYADTRARASEPRDPDKILSGEWSDPDDASPGSTAELAAYALNYLGVPYRSGGSSPDAGFDCSGLVGYVGQAVLGLKLPRRAEDISRLGDPVEIGSLQPGDLVFYDTLHRKFSHVGIYLGNGRFVHSPSSGGVVRVESMDMAYWKKRFNGARRLASSESSAR